MHKIILISIALLIPSLSLQAQEKRKVDEKQVPKPARNSFKAKYPQAQIEFWEIEGNDYEVVFKLNEDECEAVFNAEGGWIETEVFLKEHELPMEVMKALEQSHLNDWKIDRIELISTPDDEEFYEIDLKRGEERSEIYYDHNGTLLADDRWEDEDEGELEVDEEED